MATEKVEKASLAVPDSVFENTVVQERWSLTVQQIAWGLIGLAGFSLLGIFVLSIVFAFFNLQVTDTLVLLVTTVVTGCISGLVGFIAGKGASASSG